MRKNIKQIVYDILVSDEKSRCSDMYLLARVTEAVSEKEPEKAIIRQLERWNFDGLPNFNTVIRARRYIQTQHPELINKKTATARAKRERECRAEYRRKKGVVTNGESKKI